MRYWNVTFYANKMISSMVISGFGKYFPIMAYNRHPEIKDSGAAIISVVQISKKDHDDLIEYFKDNIRIINEGGIKYENETIDDIVGHNQQD